MIKLIASDMDGTLLNSNKQLSPSLYGVLKKLNDKGIVFVAISGREIFSLKEIFKDVEEDIVYASNNGNYITYKDEDGIVIYFGLYEIAPYYIGIPKFKLKFDEFNKYLNYN